MNPHRNAFWAGFWFGLNPLNSLRVIRNIWHDWKCKQGERR